MTEKVSLQLKRASQGILGNFSVVRLWLDKSPAYHDVETYVPGCLRSGPEIVKAISSLEHQAQNEHVSSLTINN